MPLFVDMDGVLVDWEGGVRATLPPDAAEALSSSKSNSPALPDEKRRILNKRVNEAGPDFWANLKWNPGWKRIWERLQPYKPFILTSTGKPGEFPYAYEGKIKWLKENLPNALQEGRVIIDADKAQHSGPGKILVDDFQTNIDPWVAKGGIGILHKSNGDTLRQLKELGFELKENKASVSSYLREIVGLAE